MIETLVTKDRIMEMAVRGMARLEISNSNKLELMRSLT